LEYRFPGNLRELENIIEKSVALGNSNIVLPENYVLPKEESVLDGIMDADLPEEGIELNEEIAKIERGLIKKALEKAQGSKSKAAKILTLVLIRFAIE